MNVIFNNMLFVFIDKPLLLEMQKLGPVYVL